MAMQKEKKSMEGKERDFLFGCVCVYRYDSEHSHDWLATYSAWTVVQKVKQGAELTVSIHVL